MPISFLVLLLSFGLLIFSANLLVNGASGLASKFGVSHLLIGLTVVAFGTSLPELTVNSFNSIKGLNDAVFGNVIGSNIFNVILILGIVGIIYPIKVKKSSVAYEIPFSVLVSLVFIVIVNDQIWGETTGKLGRIDAFILLGLFMLFLIYIFKSIKNSNENVEIHARPTYQYIFSIIGGLGLMVVAGYLVTQSATEIATYFGMSEKLIALTVLSIGTSLPELVTSSVAAYKKNADIVIGNVVGSNIFNFTFILGISGLIHPANYNTALNRDIYVLLFGSFFLMIAMFTGGRMKLDRWEAALLLASYIMYTIFIIERN